MKHSWLRLFSSVYILLVSVLLIVISAYAWMVISTSPSTGGAGFGVAGKELWKLPEFKFDEVWDGNLSYEDGSPVSLTQDENGVYIIRTGEELWTIVNLINGTDNLGDITMKIVNSIDMASETTDFDLEPIYVDGQGGDGKITVIGAKTDETGAIVETGLRLKKPLFAGGFAGNSAIVIENITIANSTITHTTNSENSEVGIGAFVSSADSMDVITLTNCHLKNSTVTGTNGERAGGLIGWTSGYSNTNDGSVKTYVTVKDCTVENSTVTSNGSVGGIIGHSGASDWTYTVVENCTVTNTKLSSTDSDDWRVGEIVGTANVGEMVVKNCNTEQVTLSQTGKTFPEGQDTSYGRLVLGTTGNYTVIDENENKAELWGVFTQLAADNLTAENQFWELHDTVTLGGEIRFQGSNVTVAGADGIKATILLNSHTTGYTHPGQSNAASGFNFGALNENVDNFKEGSEITFSNIVFENNKTIAEGVSSSMRSAIYTYAYTKTVKYTDCDFNGGVITYGDASFNGCTFNENDINMYCLFLDNQYGGIGYAPTYIVEKCTFNGNSTSYGGLKVADDKGEGALLNVTDSRFNNIDNKTAIYVNGKTDVTASGNTYTNCVKGAVGVSNDNYIKCTLNEVELVAGSATSGDNVTSTMNEGTGSSTSGTSSTTTTTTTAPATTTSSDGATTTTAVADATTTTTAAADVTTTTTAAADVTTTTTAAADATTTTTAAAEATTTTTAAAEATTTTTAAAEATTTTTDAAETATTTTVTTEATTSAEATTTPSEEPAVSEEETTEPTIEE